jgi:cyclopropane-fatty-acyl-phospholipid synthase
MKSVLDGILRRFVTEGRLSVRYPDGQLITYIGADGPEAGVEIKTFRTLRRLVTDPELAVGEAYMDGTLVPLGGPIYDVIDVLMHNQTIGGWHPGMSLHNAFRSLIRRWSQWNPAKRSQLNVAHHYDLDDQLYSLFLDQDWQYSCAYFPTGRETLEEAQAAKKRHIAAKLLLDRPGLRVLDIGCGWGGMALTLAREYGARVLGVTLSREQLARARHRAAEAGLDDAVQFELLDYRSPSIAGPYDRIVSVGMFEHVGINHYRQFFNRVHELLAPDGVALIHAIGRSDGPSATNAWIARYIFPGGYSPALSEVLPAVERSGLVATDIEILRMHYAETLRHWRRRFDARREDAAALYDERFCRMFELYLAGSELAFRRQDHIVWQLQMARGRHTVPLTRDYIAAAELVPERSREAPERSREDAD